MKETQIVWTGNQLSVFRADAAVEGGRPPKQYSALTFSLGDVWHTEHNMECIHFWKKKKNNMKRKMTCFVSKLWQNPVTDLKLFKMSCKIPCCNTLIKLAINVMSFEKKKSSLACFIYTGGHWLTLEFHSYGATQPDFSNSHTVLEYLQYVSYLR